MRQRLRGGVFVLMLAPLILNSCSRLSTTSAGAMSSGSSSSSSTSSSSSSSSLGGTPTTAELFSIASSINGQFGVAAGSGGTLLQATTSGSATSVTFPAWTLVAGPTANNLRGVAFDTNSGTGSVANVLAVGDGGAILENTSSGGSAPSPWLLGSATANFTLTDSACAGTTAATFAANLFGAAVFNNSNQPAVVVGGPWTDSCAKTKGVIAVSTSSIGALPFTGWQLVDTFGPAPGTALPAVTFRGVSYAQRAPSSTSVVVVGDSGNIFVGTVANGLNLGTSWTLNTTSPSTAASFNAAAIGSDTLSGIAVGNGIIYVNSGVGSTTVWSQLTLPSTITAANYTGVHFTTGSTLTAIVVGSSPTEILLVSNCCTTSSTVTNVTPTITGLGNLDAAWGGIGPPGGLGLASGAGGFILESDNGGATAASWSRVH